LSPADTFSPTRLLLGGAYKVDLISQSEARGALIAAEFDALPFKPRRMFIVKDVPIGAVRGEHAHKSNEQALICLAGAVRIELRFKGRADSVDLDAPHEALVIPAGVWSAQTYLTPDAMLLVLASEPYDAQGFVADA
jgi:UDP-2-acetamido-3-amino-2,3-dideoxy-glucuronate N-acetyltransferase